MARTPSGTTVAIATAFAAALSFTAATNASESVLTVTGATLTAGDYVLVTSGWGRLNNRIFRLKAASATSLTLEGCDTTNTAIFPAGLGAGTVSKVSTWTPVSQVMGISFSGGDPKTVNFAYIESEDEQVIFDGMSAITYSIDIDADSVGSAGYSALKTLSDSAAQAALRLTAKTGAVVVLGCKVALSETPTASSGQVSTNKATFTGTGRVVRYAS